MIHDDIKSVLISEKEIAEIVKNLGEKISKDYEGKELLLVVILKGSLVFAADLMRHITVPVKLDFMQASSYGSGTASSGSSSAPPRRCTAFRITCRWMRPCPPAAPIRTAGPST